MLGGGKWKVNVRVRFAVRSRMTSSGGNRCSRYACANARSVSSWKIRNGFGEWLNASGRRSAVDPLQTVESQKKRTFIEPLHKPRVSGRHPRPIAVVSASRYRTFRKGLASRPSLRQWDEIVLAYTLQDEKRRRGVAAVDD